MSSAVMGNRTPRVTAEVLGFLRCPGGGLCHLSAVQAEHVERKLRRGGARPACRSIRGRSPSTPDRLSTLRRRGDRRGGGHWHSGTTVDFANGRDTELRYSRSKIIDIIFFEEDPKRSGKRSRRLRTEDLLAR